MQSTLVIIEKFNGKSEWWTLEKAYTNTPVEDFEILMEILKEHGREVEGKSIHFDFPVTVIRIKEPSPFEIGLILPSAKLFEIGFRFTVTKSGDPTAAFRDQVSAAKFLEWMELNYAQA